MLQEKQVLIIDDDHRNIFALKAVLQAKGFLVLSASSAQDGINILQKNRGIKVVLLDMMMPDMDGYEALPIIKGQNETAAIPVIAVTAQAMVGDKEKCLQAGADDYVSKPINIDVLLALLNQYIEE